jgi:hypothetical protein
METCVTLQDYVEETEFDDMEDAIFKDICQVARHNAWVALSAESRKVFARQKAGHIT